MGKVKIYKNGIKPHNNQQNYRNKCFLKRTESRHFRRIPATGFYHKLIIISINDNKTPLPNFK